jgi:hypothetical protein
MIGRMPDGIQTVGPFVRSIGFSDRKVRFFPFHSIGFPLYLLQCNINHDEQEWRDGVDQHRSETI